MAEQANGMTSPPGGGWTPVPDPTILTNTLVDNVREQLRRELVSLREILESRLDASDKAIVLLQTSQDRIPTHMKEHVYQLQVLLVQRFETQEERFRGINLQFSERDVRTEQSERTTKVAIDAALQAQKEMVAAQNTNIAQALARIEATAQKQIEQVVTLSQTTARATDDKINDIKDRVGLIEGRSAGIGSSWGVLVAGLGVVGMIVTIFIAFSK